MNKATAQKNANLYLSLDKSKKVISAIFVKAAKKAGLDLHNNTSIRYHSSGTHDILVEAVVRVRIVRKK